MPQARKLQITLEKDQVKLVQKLVLTGQFGGEHEVIQAGLSRLQEEDDIRERWMREVAAPAYERLLADPSSGIPLEDVEAELDLDMKRILKAH